MTARLDRRPTRRPEIPGDGPQTVADLLAPRCRTAPDAEAVVSRYRRATYCELDDLVARATTILCDLGVSPGDRVAASMHNHVELVVVFLAAVRIGAIWVGVNKSMAPREVAFVLDNADVRLVVADEAAPESANSAGRRVVVAEPGEKGYEWSELVAAAAPYQAPPEVDPARPRGDRVYERHRTTGRPKGMGKVAKRRVIDALSDGGLRK